MFPTEQIVDPQGPVGIKWQIVQRHAHYPTDFPDAPSARFSRPYSLKPSWTVLAGCLQKGMLKPLLWFYGVTGRNGKHALVCCLMPTSILDRPHRIRGFGSFIVLHSNSQWREGSDLVIPPKIG